jgi:hypothetical protein
MIFPVPEQCATSKAKYCFPGLLKVSFLVKILAAILEQVPSTRNLNLTKMETARLKGSSVILTKVIASNKQRKIIQFMKMNDAVCFC